MRKTPLLLTGVLLLLILCGCSDGQNKSSIHQHPPLGLSTPEGMAEHLESLPPVVKVERWDNEYAPGITITTKHYEIHTTMLEPLTLCRVPGYMESAYLAYQQQLPTAIETQNKFTIYLFGDRDQWEKFTHKFTGESAKMYLKIQKGAYYLNGACVTYNIGRSRTFSVIGHVGWHQFNSRHFTCRLPSWLDEGMATLFEASEFKDGFFNFHPARNMGRLGSLRKVLIEDKAIPLEKLLILNPGEVVAIADIDAIMAFYAQSYALIRFLKEDDYGRHLRQFQNLLLDARTGNWPLDEEIRKISADRNVPLTAQWNRFVSPKLFAHYIDDQENMQDKYTAFCVKIVSNIRLKKK
jgi:hypothetical protein